MRSIARQTRALFSLVRSRAVEVVAAFGYELVLLFSLALIYPVTVRSLGPEGYGEYTTLYVIAGLAVTWVHAGCSAAMVQLILQRHRTPGRVLQQARRQVALVAVPACVLGVGAAVALLGSHLWVAATIILAIDLLVGGIGSTYLAVVFAQRGAGPFSVIRSVNPLARLVGVAGLALVGKVTLLTLVLVNSVATIAMLVAARAWSRSVLRADAPEGEPPSARELRSLSAMYSASMSTNAAQGEADKIVLAHFRPLAEVGEYQAAYRIASIGALPLQALSTAAVRWFLPTDDRPRAHLRKAAMLSIPIAGYGLLVAAGLFVAQPITQWVIGPEFELAVTMTLWLSFVPLLFGLAEVPTMGMLGLGENRVRMLMGFGTAFVALVLLVVLTPMYGWRGTVVAIYLSELVSIVAGWVLLYRCQVRYDERRASSREA